PGSTSCLALGVAAAAEPLSAWTYATSNFSCSLNGRGVGNCCGRHSTAAGAVWRGDRRATGGCTAGAPLATTAAGGLAGAFAIVGMGAGWRWVNETASS